MTAPEPSRGRKLLFAAILAALVLLCIEGILQIGYRLQAGAFLFERNLVRMFEPDASCCYWNQPNLALEHRTSEFAIHIYTDDEGLRTDASRRGVSPGKDPAVTRILFLGPSFTFGWGSEYEDGFVARTGAMLRARGYAVEVLNAGVPGHLSEYQLCWLRERGDRLRPDIVVFADYGRVGGISGVCPETLECPVVEDGYLYTVPPTLALRAIAVLKNSGIVWYGFQLQRLLASGPPPNPDAVGKELRGADVEAAEEDDPDRIAERYQRFVASVRDSVGREIPVVFVRIPYSFEVHPEDTPRWRHLGVEDPYAPRAEATRRIGALRARGIPIVDAGPDLLAHASDGRMYYWLDIHLTPAGNAAVADALLGLLEPVLPGTAGGAR